MRAVLTLALTWLIACETPPAMIDDKPQVDGFLARGAFASACVGLKSPEEPVRLYTATRLATYRTKGTANECLCDALYNAETHTVDLAVLNGLDATKRDDLADCVAPALTDPAVKDRNLVIHGLARTRAPKGFEHISTLLKDPDVTLRTAATGALKHHRRGREALIDALANDTEASVRAAAAAALGSHKTSTTEDALKTALENDSNGEVRANALSSLVTVSKTSQSNRLCKALLEDEAPAVRAAAATAMEGTKKAVLLDCLSQRLTTREDSSAVRLATIKALETSPSDKAADTLCKAIGPILRMYMDRPIGELSGVDVITAQNNRDWERSLECVQAARSQGGYSCHGRAFLGYWVNELGGNAHVPKCPK